MKKITHYIESPKLKCKKCDATFKIIVTIEEG